MLRMAKQSMTGQPKDNSWFDSIGIRLVLVMLFFSIVPAATVGSLAYNMAFSKVQEERVRAVGQVADAKHAQLVMVLVRSNDRAKLFLSSLNEQCNAAKPDHGCATKLIASYLKSEEAQGAVLHWRSGERLAVGSPMPANDEIKFKSGQLAKFSGTGAGNNASYYISVTEPGTGLRLEISYPSSNFQPVFDRPPELGKSGEVFLTDGEGYFVTQARYPAKQGHDSQIHTRPMQSCMSGNNAEAIDWDYRDAKVVMGFRHVTEFGSACIMAHVDEKEAFAPLRELRNKIVLTIVAFMLLVVFFAIYLAKKIARPVEQLAEAEIILEESEAKYRQLFEGASDGIFLQDATGAFIDCNENGARMYGLARADIIGHFPADIAPERQPDGMLSADVAGRRFAAAMRGAPQKFELKNKRADGTTFDAEVMLNRVSIGSAACMHAVVRDISVRKKIEELMSMYQRVIETSIDGFFIADTQGYLLDANEAYAAMSGYSIDELNNMHIIKLDAISSMEDVETRIKKIIKQGRDRFETRHRRKNGQVYDVEISTTYMADKQQFVVFCRDITERKLAMLALQDSERHLSQAQSIAHIGSWYYDLAAGQLKWSDELYRIFGVSPETFTPNTAGVINLLHPDDRPAVRAWLDACAMGQKPGAIEFRCTWPDKTIRYISGQGELIHEDDKPSRLSGTAQDITERKKVEELIHSLAFYDTLTKLPNRRLFIDRFDKSLVASVRHNNFGAVLFIDLDRFKLLNDTFGHEYGDLLLVEVAVRMRACVREMDTVARLGGDEFVVLMEDISNDREEASFKAGMVAEKIRESLARPYNLNGYEHHSSPSIGVTLYRGNEETVEELLHHADMAMYQAKDSGRNAVRFFDPAMQSNVAARAALVNDLRGAVANRQLHLHYQLQVDNNNRPVGAEALLRWIHPQRGVVMPEQFLPVAEESTLILDICDWVMEAACRQIALWDADGKMRGLMLAVNISEKQFALPGFVDKVADVLKKHRINPMRLKLELTENMVLNDLSDAVKKMHALKALGVSLSMDNFGTRYSSLSSLKQLPLDQIKLGRSFVHDIAVDGNVALLVQSIIDLSSKYRIAVIAEGVENEAQLTSLKDRDCVAYQGFLFSKAVPIEEFEKLLERGDS